MIVRILFLLLGLAATGAGGVLGWMNRGLAGAVFPADASRAPWPLVGAVALVAFGLVFLVAGLLPRKDTRRAADAKAAEHEAKLREADTYYATQTAPAAPDHPADRDWRSADLPPAAPPMPELPRTVAPPPAPVAPPLPDPAPPVAPLPEPPVMPPPVAALAVFPAAATLAPIPAAADPPPPAPAPTVAPAPAPPAAPPAAAPASPLDQIREALAGNRLEEADRLLAEERTRLSSAGDGDPVALATLTGLAGDHAAADGRTGGAKWLWRLALQRFAKADAIGSAEARAVAERLRLADQ